jgi:hypothetical protein
MSLAIDGPEGPELPPPPDSPNQGGHTKFWRQNSEGADTLFPQVHLTPGFLFPEPLTDNADLPFKRMLYIGEEKDADASLGDDGPKVVETPKYKYSAVMVQDDKGKNGEWWQRIIKVPLGKTS